MFSRSCEYAIQAVIFIVLHSEDNKKPVGLKQIAASQDIPPHFLSKILQQLVKRKVLVSSKGLGGGFLLKNSPEKLKLMHIVEIIDGRDMFDRCAIGLHACSDANPCPVHSEFKQIKERMRNVLNTRTIADLCEDIAQGKAVVALPDNT